MGSNRGYPTEEYRRASLRRRGAAPRGFQDGGTAAAAGAAAGWMFPKATPSTGSNARPYGGGYKPSKAWQGYGAEPVRYPGGAMPRLPGNNFPRGHPMHVPAVGFPAASAWGAAAALARFGVRFIPWIGLAALLWGLWEVYRAKAGYFGFKVMGYSLQNDCNRRKDRVTRSGVTGCSGVQPLPAPWNGVDFPTNLFVVQENIPNNTCRPSQWWRKTSVRNPRVLPPPVWDPFLPRWDPVNPQLDPEAMPIGRPMPLPEPVPPAFAPAQPTTSPHARPGDPIRGPVEVPRWDYPWPEPWWPGWPVPVSPSPGPRPVTTTPPVVPLPVPLPPPVTGVDVPPGDPVVPPSISASPGAPRLRRRRPRNGPRKPGKSVKERKLILTPGAKSLVGLALNFATEAADLIDAFWWALPPEYRSPPIKHPKGYWYAVGAAQKARDVWENFEHVDLEKALKNFVSMQASDMVAAQSGKALAKANRSLGMHLGLGPSL